jgi:aminoacrylate hydrolase
VKVAAPDGCALHVDVQGDGEPVVLISGFGGLAGFWTGAVPQLAQRHRVVSFDHRGRGRSGRPPMGHSIRQLASDVLAILDRLDIGRAALVGHSTGGIVAQTLALDAPSRVGRIVLSGTWARPDARFRLLFETRLEVLQAAGPRAHARLSHIVGYPPEWINAHEAEVEAAITAAAGLSEADQAIDVARLRMLLDHDRASDLGSVVAPALVIAATDDGIIPINHGRELAAAIPGAQLILTDGGHFFPRINPDRFVGDIAGFLRGANG